MPLANDGVASSVMDDLCRVDLAQMAGTTNYKPNGINFDIHVGYGPIARGGTRSIQIASLHLPALQPLSSRLDARPKIGYTDAVGVSRLQ